jgi:hypothetical protein
MTMLRIRIRIMIVVVAEHHPRVRTPQPLAM